MISRLFSAFALLSLVGSAATAHHGPAHEVMTAKPAEVVEAVSAPEAE